MTQIGSTTSISSVAASITSLSIAWPSGSADGDLAVLMWVNERSNVFPTLSTMLPGWTTTVGGDSSMTVLIATKFIGPTDITNPVTIGTLTATRRAAAGMQVYRSVGAPTIQAGSIVAASGSVPALTTPAITASAANGVEISLFGLRSAAIGPTTASWVRSVTTAGGYTEDLDLSTTAVNADAIIHISHKAVTASGAQATASHVVNDSQTQVVPYAIYIPDGNTRLATPTVTLGTKTNVTVPGGSDGTQVISWAAVTNAVAYTVEVATGAGATTGFVTKTTAATSPYTVTGLAAGTYTIAVTATP